nr:hypothetical protein [Streptomyces sp. NEAU-HV9]
MEFLGLGRAASQQPDGAEDVEEELEVFRLPVLGDVHGEVEVVGYARKPIGWIPSVRGWLLKSAWPEKAGEGEQEAGAEGQGSGCCASRTASGGCSSVHQPDHGEETEIGADRQQQEREGGAHPWLTPL